jgi:hypothetical protein
MEIKIDGRPVAWKRVGVNRGRFIGDVRQGILWNDDKQIVRLTNVEKVWADKDKTTIVFEDATLSQAD